MAAYTQDGLPAGCSEMLCILTQLKSQSEQYSLNFTPKPLTDEQGITCATVSTEYGGVCCRL